MDPNGPNVTQVFWLLLVAFIVALVARRIRVPYALALVVTGLAIGAPRLMPKAHLDPVVLLTVFLPPLLFESAINLPIDELGRDWRPIAIYTLAGTILSTFIVGGLASVALRTPLATALAFGALISTTDPISVIAVFKRLGAGRRLTLIMEAESLFNNDTAVVLFTVMMAVVAGRSGSAGQAIVQFIRLVVGGALLGGLIGAAASRVHYELDDHLIEITLTTVVAYGSYIAAEALGVSGVMAVVVAGIVIGNVGMQSAMTPGTRLAVTAFWEYAAFVVNSLVFLLVGIEVAYVHWSDKLIVVALSVVIVLIGRSAIYPLSLLVNRLGGQIPISWQHVLFWGGLRGALSMALVLGLPATFPHRETFVAATFGVVIFSLLGQGTTIGALLQRLKLTHQKVPEPEVKRQLMASIAACEAALAQLGQFRLHEAYPIWAVQLLHHRYAERLRDLERRMEGLQPDFREEMDRSEGRAKRLALLAEKSAFAEARRRGWLEEGELRSRAAELDRELIEIQGRERGHVSGQGL